MKLIIKIAVGIVLGNFLYESSLLYSLSDDIRKWKLKKFRAVNKKLSSLNEIEDNSKKTLYGKTEIGFKM